jgi:hypothetical protein
MGRPMPIRKFVAKAANGGHTGVELYVCGSDVLMPTPPEQCSWQLVPFEEIEALRREPALAQVVQSARERGFVRVRRGEAWSTT